MNFCSNCGEQLASEIRFCPNCGRQVQPKRDPLGSAVIPDAERKKKGNFWTIAFVVLAVFFIVPTIANVGGGSDSSGQNLFGVRDTVQFSSGLEFTVLTVKQTGVDQPDSFFVDEPRGRLVEVTVRILNGDSEAVTISSGDFIGLGNGVEYESAGITDSRGGSALLEELNPGIAESFDVYFDVPRGTGLEGISFRPSLFSSAVEVFF